MNRSRRAQTITLGLLLLAGAVSGCAKKSGITWPELRALDVLAEQSEQMLGKDDINGMRTLAGQLGDAAAAVATSDAPKGADNAAELKAYQNDLAGLAAQLRGAATLSDDDLTSTMTAIHPIVVTLMQRAGMPHVHCEHCEHCEHCAHEHSGHDHNAH